MKKTIQGKQCMTNKRTLLKYLKPLCGENIEDMISNTTIILLWTTVDGSKYWLKDACNKRYWKRFIERRLVHILIEETSHYQAATIAPSIQPLHNL